MNRLLKNVLIVVVCLGIAAACAGWYFTRAAAQTVQFRTAPAKRGELVATISATGTVEPEEVIDVGAQVAGQILSFGKDDAGKSIDYGSAVDEGTILAQIDQTVYDADVTLAQAQLEQAQAGVQRAAADLEASKAKLDQAQRDWERAQNLGPSDALAQASYDAYKSTYDQARANIGIANAALAQAKASVDQSEATLKRAQRNLSYCTIKSPVKGVIIDRRVNIGQTVVSSLSAPSLFLLAKDLNRMQVWASVNEADIGNLRAGQPVTFTVDAFPNRTFHGTVGKVRLNATMTQNVVTYTVEVVTDNSDGTLLPYLTANVSFQVAKRDNALLVPNAALRWSPSSPDMISPDARGSFGARQGGAATTQPAAQASDQPRGAGAGRGVGGTDMARASANPTSRPSAERRAGQGGHYGTVWIEDGRYAKPMRLRVGLTDGANTEVQSDDLKEGAAVIVGEMRPGESGGDDAKNPFAPQFPRGGGRRGG